MRFVVTVNKQVDNKIEHLFIYLWGLVLVCVQRKEQSLQCAGGLEDGDMSAFNHSGNAYWEL